MTSDHPDTKPAVLLLSGGMDSATAAAIARAQGYAVHALTFDYGQRHRAELLAAKKIAQHVGAVSHRWVAIDLRAFGCSALTDEIEVPKDRHELMNDLNVGHGRGSDTGPVPVTYVPARNTIFLAYALALAEVIASQDVFIGVNAVDYSGYPDCRPDYIGAVQQVANLATRSAAEGRPVTIHTPLIDWPKTRIIEEGLRLGVDFSLTHSCYDPRPDATACGHCDACLLRRQAFERLGLKDPALRSDR